MTCGNAVLHPLTGKTPRFPRVPKAPYEKSQDPIWGVRFTGALSTCTSAHARGYYLLLTSLRYVKLRLAKISADEAPWRRGPVTLGDRFAPKQKGIDMPRKTHAQISLLLADLYAAKQDKRKADKRVNDLEAEIVDLGLDERAYGEWSYSLGTPREILAQQAIKEMIKAYGQNEAVIRAIKTAKLPAPVVPMAYTKASIVVKPVGK